MRTAVHSHFLPLLLPGVALLLTSGCGKDDGESNDPDAVSGGAGDVEVGDALADADSAHPGCSDPDCDVPPEGPETGADALCDGALCEDSDTAGDVQDEDLGPRPDPGTPVEIDIDDWATPATGGTAALFQSDSGNQLVTGEAATSLLGDWVLENERVRFIVEGDNRAMGPCPYGGNVVDASLRDPVDGSATGDVIGEVCLFLNGGQTLSPDAYSVLESGETGRAVLAVTGRMQLLDFLNIPGMARTLMPGIIDELPLNPDDILPLTVTQYYVLAADSTALHVITAFRNDGDEISHFLRAVLIDSGGNVEWFNPLSAHRGFGYTYLSASNVVADKISMLGFRGTRSSFAFVPAPDPRLTAELPVAGAYIGVAGVSVPVIGTTDVLTTLLMQPSQIPRSPVLLHLAPNEVAVMQHWNIAGDASVQSLAEPGYRLVGAEGLAEVGGTVTDAAGEPVAGVRVSAIRVTDGNVEQGRTMNQDLSSADGSWHLTVPPGEYLFRGWSEGRLPVGDAERTIEPSGAIDDVGVVVGTPATVRVHATTPSGDPTPARVTVVCDGTCSELADSRMMDPELAGMPGGFYRIAYLDLSGETSLSVAPGSYRLWVSRGLEWSVFPQDDLDDGFPFTVDEGDTLDVNAEIARVLDTAGSLSGDFHVHSINSPDSPAPLVDRVLNFLGEGVDVLVSSDHDFITDFRPLIEEHGASSQMNTLVGEELTTADYGHYNGFPIVRDAAMANGGAFDWGGGDGPGETPDAIFRWYESFPGTQVIQVNHPDSGYFSSLEADVLRGMTFASPTLFRLPPTTPDPETGDTGLWSERFTALEIMNGNSLDRLYATMRWWLAMVGRGFRPTATAVTDTHRLYGDIGGVPRSFISVPDEHDAPATLDAEEFATAVNANRLIGTNGPYFDVHVRNDSGDVFTLGETVPTSGENALATLEIAVPFWMSVDTVEVYMNVPYDRLETDPGEFNGEPIEPTSTESFALGDPVLVASGTYEHYRRTASVPITLDGSEDAYVVFVVRGTGDADSMWPVIANPDVRPLAFSNPVFLDADGGGYDHPPLAGLTARESMRLPRPPRAEPTEWPAPEDLARALGRTHCGHTHE